MIAISPGTRSSQLSLIAAADFAGGGTIVLRAARRDPARSRGADRRSMTPSSNTSETGVAQLSRTAADHSAFDRRLPDRASTATNACPAMPAPGPRESQAPMVSITHFMDRDGQFLASVSPRRYFCTQCHVPQHDVKPPVATTSSTSTLCSAAQRREGGDDDRRRLDIASACVAARLASSLSKSGTCCAGRVRCSASAFWSSPASSPASCSGARFNTALELTNTEKFCTGCHEMRDNVFAELKTTIHYTNRSGVRASCPDCHVPHELDRQDRAQDAGLQGGLGQDLRHHQHPRKISRSAARAGACTNGRALRPTIRWNAATATAPNRWTSPSRSPRAVGRAPALPVHRRKDLHRLPQGHRPPPARHARRSRLAVAAQNRNQCPLNTRTLNGNTSAWSLKINACTSPSASTA